MRPLILLIASCFVVPMASHAQDNACLCGDYVKIALGTTWYKNSQSMQRQYVYLLEALEISKDELNKTLVASAKGTYDEIFGGKVDWNQGEYEAHYKEWREHIEQKINESYEHTSITQYPTELIAGLNKCHASCSSQPSLSCTALASDQNTVIFNIQYEQSRILQIRNPTFQDNIVTPTKVKAVPGPFNVKGHAVKLGANSYRFDRSRESDEFTISTTLTPSPDKCEATVPAKSSKASIPEFKPSCVFSNVGFEHQFSTQRPDGYKKTYTCYNLQPGSRFVAVYSGTGVVNSTNAGNEFGLRLSSPNEDTTVPESPAGAALTDRTSYVLSNSLAGIVPSGADAGNVSVTVELNICQINAQPKETQCSTSGNTLLVIATY